MVWFWYSWDVKTVWFWYSWDVKMVWFWYSWDAKTVWFWYSWDVKMVWYWYSWGVEIVWFWYSLDVEMVWFFPSWGVWSDSALSWDVRGCVIIFKKDCMVWIPREKLVWFSSLVRSHLLVASLVRRNHTLTRLSSSILNLTSEEALVEAFWWLLVQQVGFELSLLEAAGWVLQSAEAFSWRPAPPQLAQPSHPSSTSLRSNSEPFWCF